MSKWIPANFSRLFQKIPPLWQVIRHRGILKLFCLVLAFVVWESVRENTRFEVQVSDVPVTIMPGKGWAVLDQSTERVSIRFRGSRDDIRWISKNQIEIKLDLSEQTGRVRQTLKFSPRYLKAPSQARAVQFDPAELSVTLDREVERVLPVRATFDGELPAGVQIEKTTCTPACVTVRGAEQLLRDLNQVHTTPIHLDGRYTSFKTHLAIASWDQPWTVSPERVVVETLLVEPIATRPATRQHRTLNGAGDR